MRFYSKSSNYRVILQPSIPSNKLTGDPGKPGLFVLFQDGVADVNDEKTIKLMLEHRGYLRKDFVSDEVEEMDPYKMSRGSNEPIHQMAELKHGSIENSVNREPTVAFSTAQQKVVREMVKDVAKEMAKDMVKEVLTQIKETAVKKSVGRPKVDKKDDVDKGESDNSNPEDK